MYRLIPALSQKKIMSSGASASQCQEGTRDAVCPRSDFRRPRSFLQIERPQRDDTDHRMSQRGPGHHSICSPLGTHHSHSRHNGALSHTPISSSLARSLPCVNDCLLLAIDIVPACIAPSSLPPLPSGLWHSPSHSTLRAWGSGRIDLPAEGSETHLAVRILLHHNPQPVLPYLKPSTALSNLTCICIS